MTDTPFLAVDCGGTKTACALHHRGRILRQAVLASRDYPDLTTLLQAFLDGVSIAGGAVAVPGTVDSGACLLPLLGWRVAEAELAAACGAPLRLLNNASSAP